MRRESLSLPAELLRVYSPSAEVRGHSNEQRKLQTGKKHVGIKAIEPVGNYAIRIIFDDGHDSGLFAWDYLRELAENQEKYLPRVSSRISKKRTRRGYPRFPWGTGHPNPDSGLQFGGSADRTG